MKAKFSLDDDGVVVIIGSGAGGGTLADELTQRGVNVVILEAGKHYTQADFENDEWAMFNKISWLDKRIATGGWDQTIKIWDVNTGKQLRWDEFFAEIVLQSPQLCDGESRLLNVLLGDVGDALCRCRHRQRHRVRRRHRRAARSGHLRRLR